MIPQLSAMADVAGVIVPSNPEDLKKIRKSMEEISNVMTMIEAKRAFITDELKAIAEKYELPQKFVRKMARAFHTQTFKQELQEMEDFELLYTRVLGESQSDDD